MTLLYGFAILFIGLVVGFFTAAMAAAARDDATPSPLHNPMRSSNECDASLLNQNLPVVRRLD
jgi:hypothetical protein